MAYSENILPKASAYYTLSRATIVNDELNIDSNGYAEISLSKQMLPTLTSKMLVVAHPSVFSSYYTNDAVQISISILTADGKRLEFLIPVSQQPSGVFNTEIELPEGEYMLFTYRISSSVPVSIYNWELCAEDASDISVIIDGVEQTIPKLLYDYNTYAYAVSQRELTVGLISCFLHSDTDLQGHFTISFFATERCNVHVRIKDNSVTELFSPQVYTVEKGYASISIPHAYLKKKATDHAFAVTLQSSNGQLSIPVRGVLYTIDGGYLATRLLDAGIDTRDISIKQLSTDESPSEIHAVGFEGDRILLKSRVYSQLQRANWSAIKDFGEGNDCSVEFNGRWINRDNSDKFTIDTSEQPFVFVIELDGTLKVYSGEDFSNVTTLDTNVSTIKTCQGFNSMYDITQDQGLVALYIKNGNVYYRQYLYDNNISSYRWFPTVTLYSGGDATFASVHRLPDYRLGILLRYGTTTKWYITDRTYVSQAVKTEVVKSSIEAVRTFTVIDSNKVDDVSGTAVKNTFEEGLEFNSFVMTFDGPLVFLNGRSITSLKYSTKVYVNGTYVSNAIDTLEIVDNVLTVTMKEPIAGGKTVRIDYDFPYIAMQIYNGCLIQITQSYEWLLPLPTIRHTHKETVQVDISASLDLAVKEILNVNKYATESVSASIAPSIDLAVKKVTSRPLNASEVISASISSDLSLVVTQVGVTPV